MTKSTLITGITGQDGAYLAHYLHSLGYKVHGLVRRASFDNLTRLRIIFDVHNDYDLAKFITIHSGDLTDELSIIHAISSSKPDYIYNLGAQSFVSGSFDTPVYTANVTALGALRIHEAVRAMGLKDKVRIYQAGTSELYGEVLETPQSEKTPFNPVSPYAVAKRYAFDIVHVYRKSYGFFSSNGILFNHESPFRGSDFVTKKICRDLVLIKKRLSTRIELGNINAIRDWGHALEYVKMQHLIIEHSEPDDFVIATGRATSVREFLLLSGKILKLNFNLEEFDSKGKCDIYDNNEKVGALVLNKKLFRPSEVNFLLGDITKANEKLNWKPKITLEQLCEEMIGFELDNKIIYK